jgi:hypothetical protein
MKTLVVLIILLSLAGCASSKKGGCDAYGKIEKTEKPS